MKKKIVNILIKTLIKLLGLMLTDKDKESYARMYQSFSVDDIRRRVEELERLKHVK